MEITPLQQHARDLFLHTKLTRLQIAETLNIDRKTLYNWIKEGSWLQQRYLDMQGPNRLAAQYYAQLNAINDAIANRTDRPYPTKEETDIIRKLNATIQGYKKQQHISDTQQVFKAVLQRIKDEDVDIRLADKVSNYFSKHINAVTAAAKLGDDINFQKEECAFETEYNKICAVEEKQNGENGELQKEPQDLPKPATVAQNDNKSTTTSIPQNEKNITPQRSVQNHIYSQQQPHSKLTPTQQKDNARKQTHIENPLRPTG